MDKLETYLYKVSEIVNKRIYNFISNKEFIHPYLKKSILYSALAGGKKLRPALMFLTYGMFEKNIEDIIDAASAIEMIHTYSLIHDDLPSMDDDDLRRGKPTNHKVFGEGIAILAGDGLLTDAFELILKGNENIGIEKKAKAAEILAFRAGSSGMVSGQVADLLSENNLAKGYTIAKNARILNYIHQHKTADMIMASMEIGCVLSGAENYFKKISEFAAKLGLCFQITDDNSGCCGR